MLKLIGVCILLFTSVLISRELVARRRRRLALCEELLRLVGFLRLQIGCFLRPIGDVISDFESAEFSACGFLPSERYADPRQAFLDSDAPSIAGRECARIVDSLLSSLGTGYLDDEVKIIDQHRAELCAAVEAERTETDRQVRLIRTLTASAAPGSVILII